MKFVILALSVTILLSSGIANAKAARAKPVTIKLVAGVIRGNGEIVKVARQDFRFTPYDLEAIRTKLESRPGVPPKPEPYRYDKEMQACTGTSGKKATGPKCQGSGFNIQECVADCSATCKQARQKQFEAMTEWQRVAWDGEAIEVKIANPRGYEPRNVTTDLEGVANVALEPGRWYVTGRASFGKSDVFWSHVPFTVTPSLKKFELSNDNGDVSNRE